MEYNVQACGINCSVAQYSTQNATFALNPDIVGKGAIAALLIPSLLTVFMTTYAYLSDSLPQWYLSHEDRIIIEWFQKRIVSRFTNAFPIRPSAGRRITQQQRQEAITRILLSLSDQQLLTGLAILTAALSNNCTLTWFEFQCAFILAWFSSTTHLTTLDVLRDYFMRHSVVRNWRVLCMLILLAVLSYSMFVVSGAFVDWPFNPLGCVMGVMRTQRWEISVLLKPEYSAYAVYLVTLLLTVALLVSYYTKRILRSYGRPGPYTTSEYILLKARTTTLRRKFKLTPDELYELFGDVALRSRRSDRQGWLLDLRKRNGWYRSLSIMWSYSVGQSTPFISQFSGPLFSLSYGTTQLYLMFSLLWDPQLRLQVEGGLGFGQMMALILLVLPLLCAAEAYYEAKDPKLQSQEQRICANTTVEHYKDDFVHCVTLLGAAPVTTDDYPIHLAVQKHRLFFEQVQRRLPDEAHRLERAWLSAKSDTALNDVLDWTSDILEEFEVLDSTRAQVYTFAILLIHDFLLAIAQGILLAVGGAGLVTFRVSAAACAMLGYSLLLNNVKFIYKVQKCFSMQLPTDEECKAIITRRASAEPR